MAYTIKLTEEAKNDLKGMFNYYLQETMDEEYTRQIIGEIRKKLDDLKIFPLRYPPINPEDETIRAMYYKRYAIAYEVLSDMVIILNVKHTSRGDS